jgi:hypothetical protein
MPGLGSFAVRSWTNSEPGFGINVWIYRERFRPVRMSMPPVKRVTALAAEPGSISGKVILADADVLSAAKIIPNPIPARALRLSQLRRTFMRCFLMSKSMDPNLGSTTDDGVTESVVIEYAANTEQLHFTPLIASHCFSQKTNSSRRCSHGKRVASSR